MKGKIISGQENIGYRDDMVEYKNVNTNEQFLHHRGEKNETNRKPIITRGNM